MENITVQSAENGVAPSSVVTVDSLFPRKIQFQLSTKQYGGFGKSGDFRIETLNPDPGRKRAFPGSDFPKRVDGSDVMENGLDPELTLGITFRRIGAGLENLGNTCFLNSVLQCLTYTEPLAAYLQSGKHQNSCHVAGFCALCAIQKHVSCALQSTGRSLVPKDLVSNLRCISRNFRNARQEDAHEYMVNLLESMHKCCLPSGVPSESPAAYEKSLVHKIFGGRLRSQVECQQCHYCSNKFDPFLDLSLEIFKAETLNVALRNFTAAEMLDGGEKQYQCQRCKEKVKAKKRLTVHKAPYVLTIHLKRFHSLDPGRKVDKKVLFDRTLDMKPFVSGSYEGELKYSLYGVLVHFGHNTHSGHYVCFVRTSSGMWYLLNDNEVRQVSEKSVLEQKAYMLFYVRDRKNTAPKKPVDVVQKENVKASIGNSMTNVAVKQVSNGYLDNGSTGNRSCFPGSSTTVNQKDTAYILKEMPQKEASSLQNNKVLMPECSATKVGTPPGGTSSNAPLLKDPLKEQTLTDQGLGDGVAPSAPLNSKNNLHKLENDSNMDGINPSDGDILNLENASNINGTKTSESDSPKLENASVSCTKASGSCEQSTSCNGFQNSAFLVTNMNPQRIDPLVNKGASTEVLSKDSRDKATGEVPRLDPSTVAGDKTMSHLHSVTSTIKSSCESCQAGGVCVETAAGNSPGDQVDDDCQRTVHEIVNSSAPAVLPNECQQKARARKRQKKLKCKIVKCWLFRASLGLVKKKKHRKSKRRSLKTQNLIKEQLLDISRNSTELEPSTPEGPLRTCSLNLQGKGTKFCPKNGDGLEKHSKDSPMDVDGEFMERSSNNRSVLAMNGQLLKNSVPTAEEKQQGAREVKCAENSERDVLQIGATSILTRGSEETTVARWDGLELPQTSARLHNEENFSIGYVPDGWDEEYDRGKRKKLRNKQHEFGGSNLFQEIANKKTKLKKAKMDRSSSGNQPFRI